MRGGRVVVGVGRRRGEGGDSVWVDIRQTL